MTEKRIGKYWFKCPNCGSSRFEEIQVGVTVATRIEDVGVFGDLVYGDQTNEDGRVDRYQCEGCGKSITYTDPPHEDIDGEDDLLEVIYYNKTEFSEEYDVEKVFKGLPLRPKTEEE